MTHCLFDMDGLLLNTEHLYSDIIQQNINESGSNQEYTGSFKSTLMGAKSAEMASRIIERYQLNVSVNDFLRRHNELANEVMPSAELLPGVDRLVRHLYENKVPIAVATSSSKELFLIKTTRHAELFKLFNHVVCGSEVTHGKPSPDIFIEAAKRFSDQPDPSKCLVFEDAPNGVRAAIAANCQCVMVPEYYVSEEQRKDATLLLNSLEDFKPELFGLPAF